jgi:hypothetical protein
MTVTTDPQPDRPGREAPALHQEVEVSLTLRLWLDAGWDEDAVVTHVRTRLPDAFGEELTAMLNPVDIRSVRQEAEVYGTERAAAGRRPWWVRWRR